MDRLFFPPLSVIRVDSLFLHIEPAGVAGAGNFFWLGNFVLRFNKKLSYVYHSLGLSVIISINVIFNLRNPLSQDALLKGGKEERALQGRASYANIYFIG